MRSLWLPGICYCMLLKALKLSSICPCERPPSTPRKSWALRAHARRDPVTKRKRYRARTFAERNRRRRLSLGGFSVKVSAVGALLDSWLDNHPETPEEVPRDEETDLNALQPLPPSQVAVLVDMTAFVVDQP